MNDTASADSHILIDESTIRNEMIELRHYDVMRHTFKYRWDYGDHHAYDEFYCGSEQEHEWADRKRAEAARMILASMHEGSKP